MSARGERAAIALGILGGRMRAKSRIALIKYLLKGKLKPTEEEALRRASLRSHSTRKPR